MPIFLQIAPMSTHAFPALSRRQWLQWSAAGAVAAASPWLARQSQAAGLPANFLSAGKPVTLVVGGPAGGATDGVARVVAQELSKSLAHEIVVENKAGASGTIGSKFVSQARNDGHTLLLGQIAPNVLAPLMQNPKPYDPVSGFTPIGQIGNTASVLVVPAGGPRTLKEAIALWKRKGSLSYASTGQGSGAHLLGHLLANELGVQGLHVPYRGSPFALQDLVGGRVDCMLVAAGAIGSYIDAKKLQAQAAKHGEDLYASPFYQRVRTAVEWCLRRRWWVIGATVAAFVLSLVAFNGGVQKQFFPTSERLELLVDVWLPQGSSLKATEAQARKIEQLLLNDPEMKSDVVDFVSYIGNGSPRFYLPLDQQLFNDNFAQFVVMTRDMTAREELKQRLEKHFANDSAAWRDGLANARVRVLRLENGPPVGYPVQFRVSGDDIHALRGVAEEVARVMRANPHVQDVNFDWNEMSKTVRLELDQDRARALGVSSFDLSNALSLLLNGLSTTQMRERDVLVDVVIRAVGDERVRLSALQDIAIRTASGRSVPLAQVVKLRYELEDGLIIRRNRLPTVTVRADIRGAVQAPVVTQQISPQLDAVRATLLPGFRIEIGGAIEESAKGESSIKAVMPVMVFLVITLLMVQLQNIGRTVLVLLTAPLGLIGVALALLVFNVPFGFVANLGVIALSGMIMRNSVILVDQIEQDEKAGKPTWEAIVGSTVRRFRPIMLTAAAAILAMIPLSRSVFWGPMAVAIMGGLIVATLLTVFFLPALYAAWYRVKV